MTPTPPLTPVNTRYRRLRLFLSGLSFAACLGFVGLWVRSYRLGDRLWVPLPASHTLFAYSVRGKTLWWLSDESDNPELHKWNWTRGDHVPDPVMQESFDTVTPAFHWIHTGGQLPAPGFVLPDWFFAAIAGALAMTWRPSPRFRLSIRELLVLTTLTAAVLGTVAVLSR